MCLKGAFFWRGGGGVLHLAGTKAFNIIWKSHCSQLAISTVPAERNDWWNNKLVKMCSFWSPTLFSRCSPFANNPSLVMMMMTSKKAGGKIPN